MRNMPPEAIAVCVENDAAYHPSNVPFNRVGSDGLPITKQVFNKKKGYIQTIHARMSILYVKVDATEAPIPTTLPPSIRWASFSSKRSTTVTPS